MPGSLTTPGRLGARDDAPRRLAFHDLHGVGTQNRKLSRLNGWPMRSPVNASLRPSRATAHDSGPMWIATPSSQGTCTLYSLPVSRRLADVFRYSPNSRHRSIGSVCPFGATSGLMHRSKQHAYPKGKHLSPSAAKRSANVPERPERSRSALPLRQLSRFCYLINSDMVFGTHNSNGILPHLPICVDKN
jgi:hypothetical protein